ncbi:MAG: zinc-domain-containing protein [Nitrososphaeraceae archaeon]
MLEARCYKCENKAYVNEEMTLVECDHCNTKISYDEYIEIMKEKALNMGIEFHYNNDKNPF